MNRVRPIWVALAVTLTAAGLTYSLEGWAAAGAHAAARNTARISALCFIVAFAAPGLANWFTQMPSYARLVQAFFAAHSVHFVTVMYLIAWLERTRLISKPGSSAAVILIGAGLVVAAGLTASSETRQSRWIHEISMYAVFLLFFLAFVHNRVFVLRFYAVVLGIALLIRLSAGLTSGTTYRVKTAE